MGKLENDQKVVALTFEGLAPCTIVRVGWFTIIVEVVETKHLYSIRKGKITPLEEDKHYFLQERIDEDGNYEMGRVFGGIEDEDLESVKEEFETNKDLERYEDFHNPSEGKEYDGQWYTTIKTGSELLKQYFN
ncbi:hypothetical protein ACT1UG_28425 [Bacillus paramycoides]|uniref:hypothetical protein n=1 Tax=Bacillus paramycoides TaxID=2026194 RepID=UPI00405828B5